MSIKYNLIWAIGLVLAFAQILHADDSMGSQIYRHCKTCHGVQGLGGDEGKYPRIAGLPQPYLEKQLADFKNRKRLNKPMVPVFKNWRFDQDAIASVAAYVTRLPLDEQAIPAYQPAPEVLEQFDNKDQMLGVGEDIFQDCIQCHGDEATGKADKNTPPLVNQYPNYLRKQIGDFAAGRREHENSESMFGELEADEVEALLAYLSSLTSDSGR